MSGPIYSHVHVRLGLNSQAECPGSYRLKSDFLGD